MGNADTIADVSQIVSATPSYSKNERNKVMGSNSKPLNHPYFTEYKMLQKICLCILRHDKLTYGKEKDKIYGLLFDGAWLWEEYLNTLLKDIFVHAENKTQKNGINLFENFQAIYPDFYTKNNVEFIIADAKYKHIKYSNTADYYQLITYMYRLHSTKGYLLFPHPKTNFSATYKIKSTDGIITKFGLAIPQNEVSGNFYFDDFK
jgi:5-methylcytosine-specific restriction endonuclease McrBC regulatory subunit McrC